jgi:hypothetical protein
MDLCPPAHSIGKKINIVAWNTRVSTNTSGLLNGTISLSEIDWGILAVDGQCPMCILHNVRVAGEYAHVYTCMDVCICVNDAM